MSKNDGAPSKAIETAIENLAKTFGKDSVRHAGEYEPVTNPISTRYPDVDNILGCGGIPRGKIIEVYGPEASGKTWLGLSIVSTLLLNGEYAAWIDAERAFPITRLSTLVKHDKNALARLVVEDEVQSGEKHLQTVEAICNLKTFSAVVVDSVASLIPEAELNGEIGDASMGLQARMMSQALRKLINVSAETNTAIIFINQVRQKIGVFYGNPETTSAGTALKFYSSLRLRIQLQGGKGGLIEKDGKVIGGNSKIKVVKTRFGPPYGECIIPIYYYDYDPSPVDMICDLGVSEKVKVIRNTRGMYRYRDLKIENLEDFKLAIAEAKDESGKSYIELLIDEIRQKAKEDTEIKIHQSILDWTPEMLQKPKKTEEEDK